ncbi:hypothetical protein QCD70_16175 [Agreia sp. PsM10]|uniref:hypothetical protein n=1 Tax=Agreia sp. PsM10 TaxID=3030533 RepID=UPI00263B7FF0|nr:hypothetical protein [Agreia sp. PsM10]MDN4641788.1 hypothetical protein [Agreia sp. PsM10]
MTNSEPLNWPYVVSEQYSRGEISREQLIKSLTSWRYLPTELKTTGPDDDLLNYTPGSFDDIEAASLDDLIDDEIYEAAHEALRTQILEDQARNA